MNQHYVPRVYLKYFAQKRGDEYYVDVYDKEKKKFFNTNITNICAERNFYTLDEDTTISADVLTIEKIYARGFEPMYERIYNILTNDLITKVSHLERIEILLAIFQLYMRNPRILKLSINYHTQNIRRLCCKARSEGKKGITYLEEDFSFKEWTDETIIDCFKIKTTKAFKENHISGIGEMSNFHEFSKVEVTRTINSSYYFTSDNPLVVEDLINPDEHPLVKSNEFILALNPEYSVRIFHDNKFAINTINRTISPSGNTGSRNQTIFEQAQRFVIGNKESINSYFEISSFLNDTTLKLKIDAIRQIVSKFEESSENTKMMKLFKDYLQKYDAKGNLTNDEEQQLYKIVKELTVEWKKSRL